MKKKTLKTITLGVDNPTFVICPTHVDAKTFNKAFKAEGWSEQGNYAQSDLRYIYMIKSGSNYKECSPSAKGARRFTFTSWD